MHVPPEQVGVEPEHAAQAPLVPHAPFAAPVSQLPLTAEQQPLVQAVWLAPVQAASHTWEVVLQVVCAGQSAATLQPHALATHRWPCALTVQSLQAAPLPQALAPPPGWHIEP